MTVISPDVRVNPSCVKYFAGAILYHEVSVSADAFCSQIALSEGIEDMVDMSVLVIALMNILG